MFTSSELAYCAARHDPVQSIGGLLSAKEAFIKAVGTFDDVPDFGFTDVRVSHDITGRPRLELSDALTAWREKHGLAMDLSISHTGDIVGAVVVLSGCQSWA